MPGGESVIPNLIPLETQEIPVDQFDTPGAFGWMLFVWPASNYFDAGTGLQDDFYQTWMGVKYSGFTTDPTTMPGYTAALSGAVLGNFNCYTNQTIPNGLNLGSYTFNPPITE